MFMFTNNASDGYSLSARRHVKSKQNDNRQGKVITVLSAGGGCGATTIAVNLAWEIQLAAELSDIAATMVVDFDHQYGAIGTYLGVDSTYGVFDLFDRWGAIDNRLIDNSAVSSVGQPTALLSTARSELGNDFADPDPRHVRQLLNCCRDSRAWTIVDAARVSTRTATELAAHSDVTLIVTQMMIKDMRIAQQLLQRLSQNNAAPIELVVNRYRKFDSPIALGAARTAMSLDPSMPITTLSDCDLVSDAVNLGKPLIEHAPKSLFRRDLQLFAERIVETTESAEPAERRGEDHA